jgi:hypothetical protein
MISCINALNNFQLTVEHPTTTGATGTQTKKIYSSSSCCCSAAEVTTAAAGQQQQASSSNRDKL